MSIITGTKREDNGLRRSEVLAAVAEVAALVGIFLIAFTGRSVFGDGVKQFLTVLSVVAGAVGALAGLFVLLRAVQYQTSRIPRLMLGSFMAFIGIYTIVHVL